MKGIPENSLAAFENAIRHGYAVETDVHFSKDRQLIVFHDALLARMTGQEGAVAECTAAELAELRLAGRRAAHPPLSGRARLSFRPGAPSS